MRLRHVENDEKTLKTFDDKWVELDTRLNKVSSNLPVDDASTNLSEELAKREVRC